MFDLFKMTTTPLVGIDISSSAVKLLALSAVEKGYRVEAYGVELLPKESVVEKNIKAVDKVAEVIRRLMNQAKVDRRLAAISVSGSSVMTRSIQINADSTEDDIIEQIELEAERYIPFPLEEVYYDFQILGASKKNPELMDLLLAAARTDAVDTRVAAVLEAGLKVTVVDVESLAIERAFGLVVKELPEAGLGKTLALIDIGASITTLHVFRNSRAIYSRDQVFGGKHLTDEIQKRYGISLEEAIAAQKYGGLPEDYTLEVLEPFKETIVQQVNRALQVFYSSTEEAQIQYIALAGGVAALPGLDNLIQTKVGVKTFIANPFAEMEVSPQVNRKALNEDAPALLVSLGLALRTFDNERD